MNLLHAKDRHVVSYYGAADTQYVNLYDYFFKCPYDHGRYMAGSAACI